MTTDNDGWLSVQTNTSLGFIQYTIETELTHDVAEPTLVLRTTHNGLELTGAFLLPEAGMESYPDVMDLVETLANTWAKYVEKSIAVSEHFGKPFELGD